MKKRILDVTCGARSIWFDKHHPTALYCDKRADIHLQRELGKQASTRKYDIEPDMQCDFTDLPFPDGEFDLVVWDPPHILDGNEQVWMVGVYGTLNSDTWKEELAKGFHECIRVLREGGVLIFKWSEISISSSEIWKIFGQKPLFGHRSGKKSMTHWACFMKESDLK